MKNKFISNQILDQYKYWEKNKIILHAPTGKGKTTFILKVYLPYLGKKGKKVLLLVNRTLLNQQYKYDKVKQEMEGESYDHVTIMTYQALANILDAENLERFLDKYDVLIMDEFHYFINDSEFNGYGTFILWIYLLGHFRRKTIIMMSATMQEVEPLIDDIAALVESDKTEVIHYTMTNDYSYLEPCLVDNTEELAYLISEASGKAIVFVDDKSKQQDLENMLKKRMNSADINVLNSDILHSDNIPEFVKDIAIGNKIDGKVLITTSVLDNGVSIKDDVEIISIQTESPTSFIQMLGRVRITDESKKIKLIFVKQEPSYYEKREKQYQREIQMAGDIKELWKDKGDNYILWKRWKDTENKKNVLYEGEMVKKIFAIPIPGTDTRFTENVRFLPQNNGKDSVELLFNKFAYYKMNQRLMWEKKFHVLSRKSNEGPTLEMLKWIGISGIKVFENNYETQKINEFREEILKVQNYSSKEWSAKSKELFKKYYNLIFYKENERKDRGFGNQDNANKILNKYGLNLITSKDDKTKNNLYSVVEMEDMNK